MSGAQKHKKIVNLALQGGGAHGAFTWGILDKFLEEDCFTIEGISSTSAGSMNAIMLAQGMMEGGNEGARQRLHQFWHLISNYALSFNSYSLLPLLAANLQTNLRFQILNSMTEIFSPYQLNPLNINPIRHVLTQLIDFEKIKKQSKIKLFICATNVNTGKIRIFNENELSIDVILASACLPNLFQAVDIDGQHYWDGGYLGNPAIFPLIYDTSTPDVIILHTVPINRDTIPKSVMEINVRLREISFNSSLMREMRAIAFVTKLIDQGWIKPEYQNRLKKIYIHCLRADQALLEFSMGTVYNPNWDFLIKLRDLGRESASSWLKQYINRIGKETTIQFDEWL